MSASVACAALLKLHADACSICCVWHRPVKHVMRCECCLQVGILDQKNKLVPTGKIGEVCIQGPNVTKGYLNRPEANEEAFAGLSCCQSPC